MIILDLAVILTGGLENGAAAMAITTWKLAQNLDIQEKLYQEIQDAISHKQNASEAENNQHLDYNYLQNHMPYLEGNKLILHYTNIYRVCCCIVRMHTGVPETLPAWSYRKEMRERIHIQQ